MRKWTQEKMLNKTESCISVCVNCLTAESEIILGSWMNNSWKLEERCIAYTSEVGESVEKYSSFPLTFALFVSRIRMCFTPKLNFRLSFPACYNEYLSQLLLEQITGHSKLHRRAEIRMYLKIFPPTLATPPKKFSLVKHFLSSWNIVKKLNGE